MSDLVEQTVSISYFLVTVVLTILRLLSIKLENLSRFQKIPWWLLVGLWTPILVVFGLILLGLTLLGNLH